MARSEGVDLDSAGSAVAVAFALTLPAFVPEFAGRHFLTAAALVVVAEHFVEVGPVPAVLPGALRLHSLRPQSKARAAAAVHRPLWVLRLPRYWESELLAAPRQDYQAVQ